MPTRRAIHAGDGPPDTTPLLNSMPASVLRCTVSLLEAVILRTSLWVALTPSLNSRARMSLSLAVSCVSSLTLVMLIPRGVLARRSWSAARVTLRKVDGWHTLNVEPKKEPLDLAA